ncbi:MAG: MMPL family transporter [Dactylosporangium sp.]|nr:MMPL family transporter [Dactylosporangium sp.]NNJ63113.1 MMPL family transporter [Dactylosporangium sp.]
MNAVAQGTIARVGHWCFRRRWTVLGIWLVAVVLGGIAAGPVFARLVDNNNPRNVESVQAYEVLNREDDADENITGGTVIGLVDRIDPTDKRTLATLGAAARDLTAMPAVESAVCPCVPGAAEDPRMKAMLAADGRGALIVVTLNPLNREDRATVLQPIADRLHAVDSELAANGLADARVRVGGNPVLNQEINEQVQRDLTQAEILSLPITLIVLIIIFGGLVAAGLPVLAAIVSVATAMLVLLGFSYFTDLDQNTLTVVTLLGLGLSVDYGLLLVARYREELARGFAPDLAIARAWATAGRTILFSALTVAAALAGLLAFSISAISAMGAAGVSIAVVAMLTSLTFTAAMLGLTKRWVKPSKRAVRRQAALDAESETGFFARVSRMVQRRPVLVMVAVIGLLLAAATPLLSTVVKLPQLESIPRSIESADVANDLAAQYGQDYAASVMVVAKTTDTAALDAWAARWTGDDAVAEVLPAQTSNGHAATIELVLAGGSQDAAAQDLVERIRADRPDGVQSWVTGEAAILIDLVDQILDDLPLAIGMTLFAMLVLLFAMTGSLVIPIKAVLANVVSLGASFGIMIMIFQEGHGEQLLHTLTVGGFNPFVIVIVFAFAFGLSMDYEVFLLSRIKEYVGRGWDTDTAVRRGLQHTGKIITSAALLMIIVFSCFAAAKIGNIEQIGVGLTAAVLIDATLVRCLLVPATMTVLGRWNWWAPAPLARLHERIGLGEHVLPDDEAKQASTERSLVNA